MLSGAHAPVDGGGLPRIALGPAGAHVTGTLPCRPPKRGGERGAICLGTENDRTAPPGRCITGDTLIRGVMTVARGVIEFLVGVCRDIVASSCCALDICCLITSPDAGIFCGGMDIGGVLGGGIVAGAGIDAEDPTMMPP